VLAIDHDEVVPDRAEQFDEIRRMSADDRAEPLPSAGFAFVVWVRIDKGSPHL
jgi:hypothetical protein